MAYWGSGGAAADTGGRVVPPTPAPNSSRPPVRTAAPTRRRPTERIQLAENAAEQQKYDDFADMYALFVTTDRLEKLWRRDAISDAEYEGSCYRLIQKFEGLRSATSQTIADLDAFYAEYNINAASGKYRLVDAVVPGTIEVRRPDIEAQGRHNIYCVQNFISLLDNIELNQRAPENLLNICASLERSLDKVNGLPPDFPFKQKLKAWIAKLNSMEPTEELDDPDTARFKMDVSAGYNEYLHAKEAL